MKTTPSKHGGNIHALAQKHTCKTSDIIDFSANINPLGPPTWIRREIAKNIAELSHYPDPDSVELRSALAQHLGTEISRIIPGNGAEELLYQLPLALKPKRVIVQAPAYTDYRAAAQQAHIEVQTTPSLCDLSLDVKALEALCKKDDLVFLGHPNNPTGMLLDTMALSAVISKHPQTTFVIDEAFIDFAGEHHSFISFDLPNLYILRSMTKFWAIPGLRLGYLILPPNCKHSFHMPAWNINTLAQKVGTRAIADSEYRNATTTALPALRTSLMEKLNLLTPLTCFNSTANYILCKSCSDVTPVVQTLMDKHTIAVRLCDTYDGLNSYYMRIAVRSEPENKRLIDALQSSFKTAVPPKTKKKTPALMMQGCSSDAGKTIMSAALCRVLLQDGLKVAPFKSQNMSLNSYVTADGFEMSRAQVVQAQACRIDPDIRMNPILLKPSSHIGSQVIIQGISQGTMSVGEYIAYKKTAFEKAKESYDSLAAENEVMILEGAGSPGEVNLKKHDIVNMGMAAYAQSPVVIVGDIDRGGIFASFVGTMEVCDPWERNLIAGFLVNRFRGDASLLADAFTYCKDHTGKEVLGVMPYLENLGLPEEDSVSFRDGKNREALKPDALINIAIVDFPHFANISDIDALLEEPDINVRVSDDAAVLRAADAIILPGSKNTLGDLDWLKHKGLDKLLIQQAQKGVALIGICAGFQMLGTTINDPHHIESSHLQSHGLGLLPMRTEMAEEKSLHQVELIHLPSNLKVKGYEIHHGTTTATGGTQLFQSEGALLGLSKHTTWGSYLHGIFDNDVFRRHLIDELRITKGLPVFSGTPFIYDLEPAFDRLAASFRASVDMDRIYQILGI